ncbi:MAG: [FeFe] hydrogenase H-cluster maturation GTPase HydF [Bacteroidaceae bacterium]|nr:[FeFe] hydrogenase H-cluster maturation GTPase HydF [Bacteroidaceae bacterium]
MTETPRSNRYHIAVFGRRNVGKSSLVNCLAGQSVSIVSDVAGTTTDTVWKNIELPGIGAAVIGDTAGFDDVGTLGAMRVDAARRVLFRTDLAVILLGDPDDAALEKEWHKSITARHLPVILAVSKCDSDGSELRIKEWRAHFGDDVIPFSSVSGEGREALLEKIAQCSAQDENLDDITYTLVKKGDIVVLVMPQDSSAPKGRIIQPQVQTLRNLLDKHCMPLCCAPEELPQLLASLVAPPRLIITDSQVFAQVEKLTPAGTHLTSFSVLMARHKGDIKAFVEGVAALRSMPADGRILIAEACSHIPQNEDIGRVKLPRLLRNKFGDMVQIDIVSGNDFPEELGGYDLVIHCGACMFNRRMVMSRVRQAKAQGVPITNYGIAIAALNGILEKVTI